MPSAVMRTKTAAKPKLPPEQLVPPNREYLKLTIARVNATYLTGSGKNETLVMERLDDVSFSVTQGDTGVRWNNKVRKKLHPMSEWDAVYADYLRAGWILYDTERRSKVSVKGQGVTIAGKQYAPIQDRPAAEIVDRLVGYANQMVEEQYSKTIADVPDWAFTEAKRCLDELALEYETMTNDAFNRKLTHIFAVLPRRIDALAKYIAAKNATAEDRARLIEEERDRYDVLHTMLRGGCKNLTGRETILEAYGIKLRAFTPEEAAYAKKLLGHQSGKFLNGWRIENMRTEKAFNAFCQQEHLSEQRGVDYLFHGSKHQNWWSILTNGLTINPVGVIITGKAYGQGTYFAPDAIKSLGYTSRQGSKWTSGGHDTGFMAIYKVATGNRYDGHYGCDHSLNWEKLQRLQPGAHCTWAEAHNSGFRMDEVIVYKDEQSTIWGLLELSM